MHSEACQLVAGFPLAANASEEAYNNPVCVQGQAIPPVLGFGTVGSADERLTVKGQERALSGVSLLTREGTFLSPGDVRNRDLYSQPHSKVVLIRGGFEVAESHSNAA